MSRRIQTTVPVLRVQESPPGATPRHFSGPRLRAAEKQIPTPRDEIFELEGPYIINIPPMVPHSFQNLDDEVAELVVIFPTNVWEYDVLDYFPFADLPSGAEEPSSEGTQ